MTDPRQAKAQELRALGMSWRRIAEILGVGEKAAMSIADPGYREKCRLRERRRRQAGRNKAPTKGLIPRSIKPADEDVAARLAEIPDDTRDLTARICGDPLPGRSALDQRGSMSLYRLERVA